MTSRKVRNLRRKLREAEAKLFIALQGEDKALVDALRKSVDAWNRLRSKMHRSNPYPDLTDADLSRLNLEGADFSDTTLHYVDFTDSNLDGANFRNADLSGAELRRTSVREADLIGADLSNVEMGYSLWRGSEYSKDTEFPPGFNPESAGMVFVDY